MNGPVLITGASGFVGRALLRRLAHDGVPVRAAVRRADWRPPVDAASVRVGALAPDTDWSEAVRGISCVVHAAARVHVMRDEDADPLAAYRLANVQGTLALARQAARAGMRRFVFVSSIKVNGERTDPGRPFRADDMPAPVDPYGISKLEAETQLAALSADEGFELVVVRPPLVYGPGVGANFLRLVHWVRRGVPLPFASVRNLRSLVGIDNLVDLLALCRHHASAVGPALMVSDDRDLSTAGLVKLLAAALGVKPRLMPFPVGALRMLAGVAGQGATLSRLTDSLRVDVSATRSRLGWSPPVSVEEGLSRTVREWRR